jgi:hypothetical protein
MHVLDDTYYLRAWRVVVTDMHAFPDCGFVWPPEPRCSPVDDRYACSGFTVT